MKKEAYYKSFMKDRPISAAQFQSKYSNHRKVKTSILNNSYAPALNPIPDYNSSQGKRQTGSQLN